MRPKTIISTDPKVLQNIRVIVSKISPINFDNMLGQMKEILHNMPLDWDQVTEQIYTAIIDNIAVLADVFIKLLTHLEGDFKQLIHKIHRRVVDEVENPKQFEKDTLSETAKEKTKRWQVGNGLLVVHLHKKKIYSHKFLNWAIGIWMKDPGPSETHGLEVMVKICPHLRTDFLSPELLEKLNGISSNKEYPTRLRFLLNIPKS